MKSCEEYQIYISAMLDGELKGDELTRTVSHLSVCRECMSTLKAFQALQAKVDEQKTTPALPGNLWSRIEQSSGRPEKPRVLPLMSRTASIIAIAAGIILFFALGYILRKPMMPSIAVDRETPIVMASDAGSMSEERFLQLTRELLSADPKYHRRMYFILHTLTAGSYEGGLEPQTRGETEVPSRLISADEEQTSEILKY